MYTDESCRDVRDYLAQEGIQKFLNPNLNELSEQSFEPVDELLELKVHNLIFTTI